MHTSSAPAATGHLDAPLWRALAPICLMVFLEFLAMGLPLPVIPTHVHDTLGFGSLVVGLATSSTMAIAAAALTGFGFSLAFPSFGVAAIGQVPPQSRGAALGAYTACFDAAMGFGVPALGLVVGASGYGAAFAAGTLAAVASLGVAIALALRPRPALA